MSLLDEVFLHVTDDSCVCPQCDHTGTELKCDHTGTARYCCSYMHSVGHSRPRHGTTVETNL